MNFIGAQQTVFRLTSFQRFGNSSIGFLALPLALLLLSLGGCGGGDGGSPQNTPSVTTSTDTATGAAIVSLGWQHVADSTVIGYVVHYGSFSPNSEGSCGYDHAEFFSSNEGTIGALSHGTRYFFAVSAFNGLEGPCSREVSTVTPS